MSEEKEKTSKAPKFAGGNLPTCALCHKPVDSAERKGAKVYVNCHGSREGRVAGSKVYFGG